jgi:ATP-independent RNA helicase DbpA
LTTFKDFSIPLKLLENLNRLGYQSPTPIQKEAIPLLQSNSDLIAQAKTGSGKTLAFLLPLLLKLQEQIFNPQALIIVPTRELCEQIAQELIKLAQYRNNVKVVTLYGGKSLTKQVDSLEKGADIIIGTPGRLLDHLSRETIVLEKIETLILDEADRILDMGFANDILKLTAKLPKKRQSILFSATYPKNIEKLSSTILNKPQKIIIEHQEKENTLEEFSYISKNKEEALLTILKHFQPKLALIFCNTKVKTNEVSDFMYHKGFDVSKLTGDLEQYERQEMLLQFSNGSLPLLVATDLAARGLDIEDIDLVINYDVPQKAEEYTHRIGRTGRYNKCGFAITLCDEESFAKLKAIRTNISILSTKTLDINESFSMKGNFSTLCIEGGKKKKIRAGDILGTLCKDVGIENQAIGKINIYPNHAYVAVKKSSVNKAFHGLMNGKIKGKKVRVWWL